MSAANHLALQHKPLRGSPHEARTFRDCGFFGMIGQMSAILYPVAANPELALNAPQGRAAREREASDLAGRGVVFVSEATGPAFATMEAALDAYAGKVEDERPGHRLTLPPEDRFCRLVEVLDQGGGRVRAPGVVKPVYKDGRRWPEPKAAPRTVWRLQVSYWRSSDVQVAVPDAQARKVRRSSDEDLPAEALRALTRQPLRPVRPQQPLDIGLFETRLPESPDIVVPDE